MEVEDYLAKIDIDKILYVNKIPLNKIVLESIPSYNPMTMQYRDFWTKETEKCIDGFWVEHEGKWKYVPGALYFYGTHWHILLNEKGSKSKTKKIARPKIRDLEWIKFYLYIVARGFSGFDGDDEYSCHRELSLPEEERTMEFIGQSCYNRKGKLKKYVPAGEYLYKYHSKPLGKPVFENMALNVVDVESRGTGKSFTMSALGGINFTFDGAQDFEEYWNLRRTEAKLSSETLIGAIDSKYSDDLIKKIKLGLDSFKGEYTLGRKSTPPPFSKGYAGQWIAGKTIIQEVEVKEGGRWKKKGSRSKIQHRTFMDNEFAANGTRASFNVLDEIGFFYNLIPTLGQMKECTADGALKFGTIWMCGTGGDMEGGSTEAVMRVFYDPITYDCVPFDDNYEGSGKQMGFFIPAWMGLNQFKDDLGNTNYKSAIQYILNVRKKLSKGKDRKAYDDELSQRPIFPSEVFLISGGNILPTGMLKDQLQNLETSTTPEDEGVLGHMKLNPEGKPEFVPDIDGALQECDWPVKKGVDNTGAVRVWEQPAENAGFGYYLAGIDPYDQDKAPNSVSLGSLIIMKRASPGVSPYDFIVAEYTGRPETAKEFYEQCRLLLFWYGIVGTCLYENEKIGIKTYFENNNCLHLLAPTPSILKSNITSNVNRQIGQHMSSKVKDEAEIMLRDWLVTPAGDGKLNLHNIKSKPILRELINYNKIGNFDRCFTGDTMITTKEGLKEIKDIVEGDEVLTHKGRFRKVTKHSGHVPEDKELLHIDIHSNIDPLKLTKNHPVYSIKVKRNGVPHDRVLKKLAKGGKWYNAEELVKGDLVLLPKRKNLKKTNISDDMLYLLGWYISDGWASMGTDNAITIALHTSQEDIADKLCAIADKFYKGEKKPNMRSLHAPMKKIIRPNGKECIVISVKSKKLKTFLQYYGGVSHNKFIHNDLYNSSGLLPLVVGFLEGDGHQKIDKNKRNIIEVVSVHKKLTLQVKQILIDNDIYSSLCVKNTNSERRIQYCLQLSGKYVLPIVKRSLKFKVDTIYTRDKNFAYKTDEGFWVPIKKISTFTHEGLVYNFSVDEDETYVASGIVVHNCIALMLCVVQMTQMYKIVTDTKEEEFIDDDPFFSRPLFQHNVFGGGFNSVF